MGQILVSLDIGTSKVSALVSRFDENGQLEVLGKGISNFNGLKKGIISNIEYTSSVIRETINKAEKMSGCKIYSAYVSVSGINIDIFDNSFSIDIISESKEITKRDVEKLQLFTNAVKVPKDCQIIDVIPKCYIIDRQIAVNDPIGMTGSVLAMEADIVVGNTFEINNIIKSIELAGLKVDEFIIEALAHGESMLYEEERVQGSLVIDVGGAITNLSVFKNDSLIYFGAILVGGNHITNDISVGCGITYDDAEKIKKRLDKRLSFIEDNDEEIILLDKNTNEEVRIKQIMIKEIIEARIDEIFYMCKEKLFDAGMSIGYISNVVLTGRGISYTDLGKQICSSVFDVPTRIATGRLINMEDSIEYYMAAGLSKYVYESIDSDYGSKVILDNEPKKSGFSVFRWFLKFLTG